MSERRTEFVIEEAPSHPRMDSFLRERFEETSRALWQRLIRGGQVLVNGCKTKPNHKPKIAELISIDWPAPEPSENLAEEIPLEILYEDEYLLVLNKQPGIVVHPGAGHRKGTLVNALLHHCAGKLSGIGGVERPGIVHRLDKDTSGCLVIAKDDFTHQNLSRQLANRKVTKIYLALLCGNLRKEKGEIHEPIARHPKFRKKMTVTAKGRPSHTSFQVQERFNGAVLVEAQLHTGRTHQIRVHFQHLGHPVIGDLVYGERANRIATRKAILPGRQMLHAKRIEFIHPKTRKTLRIDAPLPEDFKQVLATLRKL
ncbi:MAG: RluA family pseudouridine synthase [Pedosphaera sp.]|nr:RluA family pseudouridine synthase [Pedosphaera sp.]